LLAKIVSILVEKTVFECLRAYVDQIVNILRAICMDPYGAVIIEGCKGMTNFAVNGDE